MIVTSEKIRNMALYCDFENVALGVRDAKHLKNSISARCWSDCCSRAASW